MSSLRYQQYGEGKACVLLGGWGFTQSIWAPFIPLLSSHYQVTCFDLPGVGENADCSVTNLVEAAEMILSVIPDQAYWLGWSLGGLLAFQMAALDPKRCTGLVTFAAPPCWMEQLDWRGISRDHWQALLLDFNERPEKFWRSFLAMQLPKNNAKRSALLVLKNHLAIDAPGLSWGLQALESSDFRKEAREFKMPQQHFFAEQDSIVPPSLAERSHGRLLKGAGHADLEMFLQSFLQSELGVQHA